MTTAFYIQKGGVGKTTLSGTTAHIISKREKTVLIDADPQGNASSWLLTEPPAYELADLLQDKISLDNALIEISENFYIIPTFGIGGELKQYGETRLHDEPFIFQELVSLLKGHGFKTIIFDLSPGLSRLEKSVLLAVDEVVTPMIPESFAVDGIQIFDAELKKLNKSFRVNIRHSKIVCNNFNQTMSIHKKYREDLQSLENYRLYEVPQDSKFKTAQDDNKTLLEFDLTARALPELYRLSEDLINGI